MMKRSTFARTALATLLAMAVTPVPAADPDMPARGPVPFSSFDADGNGQVSQEEFNRAHTERLQQRETHQQQYQQRQQQMYQERMNMNSPGGMGSGQGGGRR